MNDYEKKLLANIEKYGCSVTSVVDPDGDDPPFTYSIGIARSSGAPELIVVGLDTELAHALVNDYHRRVRAGERFESERAHARFLEGEDVRFVPVSAANRERYMRSACWLHGGPDFAALQMVWPDDDGRWPWDPDAPQAFRLGQPLLG